MNPAASVALTGIRWSSTNRLMKAIATVAITTARTRAATSSKLPKRQRPRYRPPALPATTWMRAAQGMSSSTRIHGIRSHSNS
jgi:hypothetical protein